MASAVVVKPLSAAVKADAEGSLRGLAEPPETGTSASLTELGFEVGPALGDVAIAAEVEEARFNAFEEATVGPRLSSSIPELERMRLAMEQPPRGVLADNHRWREYVSYFDKRIRELKQAEVTPPAKPMDPPLRWPSYEQLKGLFERGLKFEREIAARIEAETKLPPEQRTFTKGFNQPRVLRRVGMKKEGSTIVRYADIVVIEDAPAPGTPRRVETYSVKSRDFTKASEREVLDQTKADANAAKQYYGGEIDIRTKSLGLRGQKVTAAKVRLIYDASLQPLGDVFKNIKKSLDLAKTGVEVEFR